MNTGKKIVVIGSGISGLTAAYLLNKEDFDVTVLEQKETVGGSIETIKENDFLFDRGPNSGLETTSLIQQLVKDLNLQDQFVYANKEGNKRYILRDSVLHALPMSPPAFIKSKLFSAKAKLRLMREPFVGKSKDGYYQSIAEFVTRRLGKEFLDYAINPFVAGVYAGRPEELSVKSAFPKLYALEEEYGGIIIGSIRSIRKRKKREEVSKQSAKMFSFKDGMKVLPEAISKKLGNKVHTGVDVLSVKQTSEGNYGVTYKDGDQNLTLLADAVLSTIPAFKAVDLFGHFDDELVKHLNAIYYPPVLVVYLVYERSTIEQALDGFGFLIPEKEERSFLGAIWSSVIFPNRTDETKAAFTLFIGGARDAGFVDDVEQSVIDRAREEFEKVMRISGKPLHISKRLWAKAIPQYNIGYVEHENYFDHFEKDNKGIILGGNYRGGISVGDCIKNAEDVASKVKNLF
ncbi:MAG: protoporphyrinogen oxidase [Ignavibacteria bacterium]|nr:protoporphyrinogen oxidase [Ignavibacteria bacterium]MBT8383343.1 protoporphyrinogen oxidase [Ignavibacteria bacterium]MBT8391415.1 protoporphyrinogen oxidase [Ignavibacteria bacterium]NNJ52407.1 protoporphyrinogen oxidase [Ignavibacteriaceae bacterium]NNL19853.1 protoporphyrinogen oxidase [Ignavibacteriaceae bacterium]